jgi:uncharacterized protein YegL
MQEFEMRNDLTDITVVLDRSGSMASIRKDMEGGLNAFVDKQKTEPGHANFTLVQFDTQYEFVHRAVPINDVPACTLVPRGGTALLDAVGKAIAETGERLKATPEDQRPGLVVFLVITDGQENSSREFKKHQIKEMIEHQQNAYKWQFTYLGANQDSFAEAGAMGFQSQAVADYAPHKSPQMFAAAAANVNQMRTANRTGAKVRNTYTEEDRKSMS